MIIKVRDLLKGKDGTSVTEHVDRAALTEYTLVLGLTILAAMVVSSSLAARVAEILTTMSGAIS